jgi:hypothetical protein
MMRGGAKARVPGYPPHPPPGSLDIALASPGTPPLRVGIESGA